MLKTLRNAPITGQLLRFGVSTGFSAALSFGLPVLLHEWLAISPRRAVAIGFIIAYLGNILLLRLFVFRSRGSWMGQVLRYIPTNGAFRLCEYLGFLALYDHLRLDYRLALVLVLGVSAILKFFAYRLIFTDQHSTRARTNLEPSNPLER